MNMSLHNIINKTLPVIAIAGASYLATLKNVNAVNPPPDIPITRDYAQLTQADLFDKNSLQERIDKILELGEYKSITGTSEVVIYDDFENKRAETQYFVNDDGVRYRIHFDKAPRLKSGQKIIIDGIGYNNDIVVADYEILDGAPGKADPRNLGDQKTVVLLVNFLDNRGEPGELITTQEASNRVFDDTNFNSINSWVKEVSYQKAFMSGDVFGWYSLQENQICNIFDLAQVSMDAANADVDFLQYDRLIVVFPDTSICNYDGFANIGPLSSVITPDGNNLLSIIGINGPLNIDDGTGAHELGHNFGNYHAGFWECGDTCQSDPIVADPFDIMGSSGGRGHFNAFHKETVGWFDPTNILGTTENGIYFIEPIEITTNGLQALKIPIANGLNYSIEYRIPEGYDSENYNFGSAVLGIDVYAGAMLHLDKFTSLPGNNLDTQLLDMFPNSNPNQLFDAYDVVLREGQTFEDPDNNVSITTLSVTPNYLEVRLGPPPGSCCQPEGSCTITLEDKCTTGTWTEGQVCNPNPCTKDIPTVSKWGLIAMALLVLSAGTVILQRKPINRKYS